MASKLSKIAAPKPLHRPPSAHQIRIIGGDWKRTPLTVLDATGLRPTPDRVRETVFNWLTHLLDGQWPTVHCLDLFAGSGALGLEAASRGAASVVLVESNTAAVRQLEVVRDKLHASQVDVIRGDARLVARHLQQRNGEGAAHFTLIFLDPPYDAQLLPVMLPLCESLLAPGGVVYVEAAVSMDVADPPDWLSGWEVIRGDRAGAVFFHLLQRRKLPLIQA